MKCNAFIEQRCKSCQFLSLTYEQSLKEKEEHFFKLIESKKIKYYLPIIGLKNPELSRNKAKLAVSIVDHEICFGIYDSWQVFKKLEDCPLHLTGINSLLDLIKNKLTENKIIPYDLKTKTGEIKYLLITKSETTKQVMIRFVLRSKESLDRIRKFSSDLKALHPEIKVISVNIQPDHKAIFEGDEEIILGDCEYIEHQFDEFVLELGVKSFFQVTSQIAIQLYNSVSSFVEKNKVENLLDLYCGVGAFSFYASRYTLNVLGIEISKKAIEYANHAKDKMKIANIEFICADVDLFLKNNLISFDAIILNPPRRGVGEKNINQILSLKKQPQYIIYSSCNAETLALDLITFSTKYDIVQAQLFDMFPFSKQYEALVILKKLV
jgi:23S rRNA (uracil747-C5)-methyltransferase